MEPGHTASHGKPAPAQVEREQWAAEMRTTARFLVDSWKDVLAGKHVGSDVLAGLTVGAVALPLNLALASASGMPPSAGLLAGALGGLVAAMVGGHPLAVTGPAAALSTMVFALVQQFGVAGATAAALVVGVIQIGLGFASAGRLAGYVPEAVLAGFTTGVGLKLLDNQVPELLGFDYRVAELAQMMHQPLWLHHVSWLAVVSGLGVAMLVVGTAQYKRFPAALLGITVMTFLAVYLGWDIERVGAVPNAVPPPSIPPIPDERWLDLAVAALPLALLASVETLLAARVMDRLSPDTRQHNANLEMFGQGVANMVVGLFGGMPVSGVVVRSTVNVQSGGRTRLSAMVHGLMLLACVMVFSEKIALVPLAALAGLLCVVGVRLLDIATFIHLAKTERLAAVAFLLAMVGTVSGHLITGLGAGLVLHALNHHFTRHSRAAAEVASSARSKGIRAVLQGAEDMERRPQAYVPSAGHGENWLSHIRQRPTIPKSAFVHRQAAVIGRVVLGEDVHIAAGSSVRADEGAPFFIGSHSNVQDGVVIHALKDKHVQVGGEQWAVYVGRNVSMAHNALIHGPCFIGDGTFVGFKAVVHDSVVGANCYVGIGAVVVGVEIPDGRMVPHGMVVDTADKVAALPLATGAHHAFNEDVVDVNRGLAAAYHAHADQVAPHEHRHPLMQHTLAPHRPAFRQPHFSDPGEPAPWDERLPPGGNGPAF